MSCLLKIVFGGCGGDPGEDSQTDPGIVGCSSSKEYLEKSLFPGIGKDLWKEPEGRSCGDKSGCAGCFPLQNIVLTSVRNPCG